MVSGKSCKTGKCYFFRKTISKKGGATGVGMKTLLKLLLWAAPLAALAERGLSAPELEVRERLLESKAQAQQAALA